MSERSRDNERKQVSEPLATPSIDLTNKTPNDVALALLACLPDDATLNHEEAKRLLQEAFDQAKAELQQAFDLAKAERSIGGMNCLYSLRWLCSLFLPDNAALNHEEAKRLLQEAFDQAKAELQQAFDIAKAELQHRMNDLSLLFCNEQVSLPADVFLQILDFLPKTDLVLRASEVSKAWLAMSRSPQLWTMEHGLLSRSTRITNMDHLLALLERPQFALLKTLAFPNLVRLQENALEKIAESCPLLVYMDIGGLCSSRN
jgi:polyhydroxyalkanoate synthesis regulator phasin